MTTQQWEEHSDHLNDHITWPASKQQIVEACNGEDVEAGVLEEIKAIPDQEYASAEELKKILVKSE